MVSIGFGIFNVCHSFSNKRTIEVNSKTIDTLTVRIDANTKLIHTQSQIVAEMQLAASSTSISLENTNNGHPCPHVPLHLKLTN